MNAYVLRDRLTAGFGHLVAIGASLIMFVPIYLVAVNSLKSRAEASTLSAALPTEIHWENFAIVVEQGKLLTGFLNSLLYSGGSTAIGTLIAAMAAFVLSRRRTSMNRSLYFFLIMGIALPVNFFTLTSVMQATQMINTRHGMIILYAAQQIPFAVFLIYGFIESIPRELDEAGCSSPSSCHCSRRSWSPLPYSTSCSCGVTSSSRSTT
jgi:raffinose/stachyose/melibiose transport system permease protein